MLEEQLQIVQHYMNHQEEYKLDNGEWWENLKKLKLKDKTDEYINQVSDLIDEWIDYGKNAFYEKYEPS
jgi:protein associated with RNAse G/E